MRRMLRTLARAAAFSALPTAAYAVNVSSGNGYGTQWRIATYSNGVQSAGNLTSTQGYPVYYWGKVNWTQWWCSSSDIGRYTADTTSRTAVSRGGYITYWAPGFCTAKNVNARVARNIPFAPDPVGPWSSAF